MSMRVWWVCLSGSLSQLSIIMGWNVSKAYDGPQLIELGLDIDGLEGY